MLSMEGKHFEELLGPVLEVIDDKIKDYKRSSKMDSQEEQNRKRRGKRGVSVKDTKKATADAKAICGLTDLKTVGVLGKGGFGLVTLVQDPKSGKAYALKAIKKFQVRFGDMKWCGVMSVYRRSLSVCLL